MNPFRFIVLMFTWPFIKGFWWSEEQLTQGANFDYASNYARQTGMLGVLNNGLFPHEMALARVAAVVDIVLIGAAVMIPMGIAIVKNLLLIAS